MAIKGFQRLSSRHDHMAVMVRLDKKWFLVDAGWVSLAIFLESLTDTGENGPKCAV